MNKKFIYYSLIGLAIVVIAIAIIFSAKPKKNNLIKQDQQKSSEKVLAPKGQLVDGFDKSLIIDNSAEKIESYSIPYSENQQLTTSVRSDKSISEVYQGYLDYFNKNGIYVQSKSLTSAIATIFGFKGSSNYSLLIQKDGTSGKTMATITVVKK